MTVIYLEQRKIGFGHNPATEKDCALIEKMSEEIIRIWGKCPGIYVGGYGEFCLDTLDDIPDKVRSILRKYKPKLQKGAV